MKLVSFSPVRYNQLITDVEEQMQQLQLTKEEIVFYEKVRNRNCLFWYLSLSSIVVDGKDFSLFSNKI